jgi:hypothetical protein
MIRNNGTYFKQPVTNVGQFVYYGTAALKRGYGMCFDLDYYLSGSSAAEIVTARAAAGGEKGLKTVAVPSATNANRFAGVLMHDVKADANGKAKLVTLALPGGCAEIAQRVISTDGVGRVTCIVDQTAGDGLSGLFGHGGLCGRGSAVPLQTLAAATLGNLAKANDTGTASCVYSGATGLTTVTLTGAGTALGYVDAAVAADSYELTVVGGATAATGHATTGRAVEGIYPVVQATGADTFTVTGNVGDPTGATTLLTKKGLLMLAYLEDGNESGLSEYVTPKVSAASQFVLSQGGTTFVCGGLTLAGDSTATLADPITIGGLGDGARKAIYALATNVTNSYLVTVTSGLKVGGGALANVDFLTAGEWTEFHWEGNFGPGTAGLWRILAGTGTEA